MKKLVDLKAPVRELFLEGADKVVPKTILAEKVIERHAEDRDLLLGWAKYGITQLAEEIMRGRRKADNLDGQGQLMFADMKHVTEHYSFNRDGRSCSVPVVEVTKQEFRTRVEELRAHGHGALAHADELEVIVSLLDELGFDTLGDAIAAGAFRIQDAGE